MARETTAARRQQIGWLASFHYVEAFRDEIIDFDLGPDVNAHALELLAHAAARLSETDLGTLAAQVPSDAPHLLRHYQQLWRRQGAFPVFELAL